MILGRTSAAVWPRAAERSGSCKKGKIVRLSLMAGLVGAAGLLASDPAVAGRWQVSNLGDSGAGSLRQAIEKANAEGGGDIFARNLSGVIRLESPLPEIRTRVRLYGPTRGVLAIDADQSPGMLRVLAGASCTISDLTFSNAVLEVEGEHDGGAAIVNDGRLLLCHCTISDCILGGLEAYGAGILNRGEMEMKECVVRNCEADYQGGLYRVFGGGVANLGRMSIEGCQIADCRAYQGGGILNEGDMWIVDSIVEGCVAVPQGDGGGILNYGALEVDGCVIWDNQAFWSAGLGSYDDHRWSTLTCRNTLIARNTASDAGGGLFLCGSSGIEGCTVAGNTAEFGGGLLNMGESVLVNSTWSANGAWEGSGIFSPGYELSSLDLLHCTIAENVGGDGVLLEGVTEARANNCIIALNDGLDVNGMFLSLGHNLFGEVPGVVVSRKARGDLFGEDPCLGPLQDNGGPTPTHALLPDSPAIDNGTSAGLREDQRGFDRKQNLSNVHNGGDGSDIGAYETQRIRGDRPRRGR